MSEPEQTADVAIIGSGPAGLAAAIELGMRGLRCILIERTERGRVR